MQNTAYEPAHATAGEKAGSYNKSVDLLCLGEPLLELNQQADGRYLSCHGGDTCNVAVAASRLGANAGYFSRIGDDVFGRSFFALWEREGVHAAHVIVDATAPTGIYFVTHDQGTHHFSYRRAGSAASLLSTHELPVEYLQQSKILHVSGISQGISSCAADAVFAAIDIARDAGVQIAYDTNYRPALWPLRRARAITHAAMANCDIALPGLEDARALTELQHPNDIIDFYLQLGCRMVALTLGTDGVLVATHDHRHSIPAYLLSAVDATGAGDTFDGAFLARLLAGDDPFIAAAYANAAAALSTQHFGAVPGIPDHQAIEDFINQPGYGQFTKS